MARVSVLAGIVVLLVSSVCLSGKPVSSPYDMQARHGQVEMIELAPGVVVRADIWPDSYVPTVADFVAVGLSLEDAEAICNQRPNTQPQTRGCTWGEIKLCYADYCVPSCCPENCPEKNDG